MMGWFSRPAPPIARTETAGRSTPEKIDFHIARFTRAIEQCTKPERLAELQANLDYWKGRKALEERLG